MEKSDTKKNILWVLFVVLLILSNIVVLKHIMIADIEFSASIFVYPFTFLIMMLLREFYEYRECLKVILMAIFCQLLVIFTFSLISLIPVANGYEVGQELLEYLVADYPIIVFSLVAFTITQMLAITLYKLFKKYFYRYLAVFFAMLFSLALDALIFISFININSFSLQIVMPSIASAWIGNAIIVIIMTFIFAFILSYMEANVKVNKIESTK